MEADTKHMLQMAAKAASIKLIREFNDIESSVSSQNFFWAELNKRSMQIWCPINYDGDAFRLAVQLNMIIEVDHYHALVNGVTVEVINGDKCAAVRLAITKAAAAIGEAIP